MKKILCINTGGTFNKAYNHITGGLEIDTGSKALEMIKSKWQYEFENVSIIGKDSLELNNSDRLLLLATINLSNHEDIIVIHGTDTMELTAAYLAESETDKRIVLTGAMVPYSIDPTEATANFASAYGYIQSLEQPGIYIAMNGLITPYDQITKNRAIGKFIYCSTQYESAQ